MKLFCDGVFDLLHYGHINHFKKIKELYPNSYLLVGILNDEESTLYKRQPIFNERKRLQLVESCKYVDEVTLDYPSIMTEEFINTNNIDLIIHAFSDKNDFENQNKFFLVPIKLNKFKEIDYDKSISTTSILSNINNNNNNKIKNSIKEGWDLIWEKKGSIDDDNLFNLNGYDETNFNPELCFNEIKNKLNINKNDKILEIGCGAGLLSKLFDKEYNYFGIDYSSNLIQKNIKILNCKVYNCEANKLIFKDKYFDYTFSVCVFEYFPSKEYMFESLKEIIRVKKKGICILNIRKKTHNEKKSKHKFDGTFQHLIFSPDDFKEFQMFDANYEINDRFSIIKHL